MRRSVNSTTPRPASMVTMLSRTTLAVEPDDGTEAATPVRAHGALLIRGTRQRVVLVKSTKAEYLMRKGDGRS